MGLKKKQNQRVFIDLETGGLNSITDGITQIAAVTFDCESFDIVNQFSVLVKGVSTKCYGDKALQIQNRTREEVMGQGADLSSAYILLFNGLVKSLGLPGERQLNWAGKIWAHNAPFDWSFLEQLDRELHGDAALAFTGRPYFACSKYLMASLRGLGRHDYPFTGLESSINYLGGNVDITHEATADCLLGIQLLKELTSQGYV